MNGARREWTATARRAWPIIGCLMFWALAAAGPQVAQAEDISPPPILQWFEATYDTMERRAADAFLAGYGSVYTPPPGRADLGNFSVGYDVYDRFDLGKPNNPTLYGTESGLKYFANMLHRFNGRLHIDAVLNHNGYSENDYENPQFNSFLQAGGYPGFVLQNPDGGTDPNGVPGTFGDFHDPVWGDHYLNGQLSDLLDIGHPVQLANGHQLIRHPVAANSQNIPAGVTPAFGRLANVPDPANARFYPDQQSPGVTYFNPKTNQNETIYPFNLANPLAGDAAPENATGILRRYLQWMVQVIGVDGFRLDAAKHMEYYALDHFDAAVYRSNPRLLLDGSVDHVFMYGEVVPGSGQPPGQSQQDFLYGFIRKDINPGQPNTIGGNRDVLDFPLRGELSANLQESGVGNDWRNVVNSSMDVRHDGLHNGSAGVAMVSNHDGGGAQMNNVAHAYILTQPGNAIVYYNAKEFGTGRNFPVDGRGDALGNYGNTITELINIRNTHGRGNYRERWLEKDYFAMERSKNMLVLLDNRNDVGSSDVKTMDVDFAENTRLVELTGNAAANGLDQVITVFKQGTQSKVNVRFLHNGGQDKGYLIYGVQVPQSSAGLVIQNASSVLEGGPLDSGNVITTAKTRLADLPVVHANQIDVRLDTQAVTLPGGYRDLDADGDNAVLRVNNGVDINGNGHVDYVTPGSVVYGFEEFAPGEKSPGYGSPSGNGWYQKSINATNLPEGYNYITVRAFRHRSDGGPAVFNDFKQVVYLDRVAPPAAVVSFAPYASDPNNQNNRDLIMRSVDGTANNMHVLMDLPATLTNSQILAMVSGSNQMNRYDRDLFLRGTNGVSYGNHVATVVTYEPTYDGTHGFNIQRFAGLFAPTSIGIGFGDMNFSNSYTAPDIRCSSGAGACGNNSVEDVLYSKNSKFRAAFDLNGDGLGDNRDLFLLQDVLVAAPAGSFGFGGKSAVLDAYSSLLLYRADVNNSGSANATDVALMYSNFGAATPQDDKWLYDMDVNGVVNESDVLTMITKEFRTLQGDFNVDGQVDIGDYLLWRKSSGVASGALYTQGDADLDRDVDQNDLAIWQDNFGFVRQALTSGVGSVVSAAVPEPCSAWLFLMVGSVLMMHRKGPWGRRSRGA
jgi:glycosidase